MTEHCDIDRQKFKELFYKLSESINYGDSLEDRKDIYNHFEDLYCNPELNSFNRHYYSDIFEVMSAIKDEGTSEHTLDALILNIEALFSNYYADTLNQEKLIDLYPVIKKLYDHISLERSRMDYVDKSLAYSQTIGLTVESLNEKNKQIENNIANNTARWEIEVNDQKAKVAELKDSIRNYELKMDDFSSNLDNTSKKLDKAQIDYISILESE